VSLSVPRFSIPRFSILIPAHNLGPLIDACLASLQAQTWPREDFEVIVADDASEDDTVARARACQGLVLTVLAAEPGTPPQGPGSARNRALAAARGDYVVFLDGDDALVPQALARLAEVVQPTAPDLVAYDWTPWPGGEPGRRKDWPALEGDREARVRAYLAMECDGSVIYTAMKRAFLQAHDLAFRPGLHEDIDFIFQAYWHARSINLLHEPVYLKRDRPGSVVQGIGPAHVTGYVAAWQAIRQTLEQAGALARYAAPLAIGLNGMIGVVVGKIFALHPDPAARQALLATLFTELQARHPAHLAQTDRRNESRYDRIANAFLAAAAAPVSLSAYALAGPFTMGPDGTPPASPPLLVGRTSVRQVGLKPDLQPDLQSQASPAETPSLGCEDLMQSVFLAPNEIRTCCKRFFHNGAMQGDVVLLRAGQGDPAPSPEAILSAKQDLLSRIRAGEATPCTGCPWLRQDTWPELNTLRIRHLSFEQNSVCSMHCTYCSERYYGGEKAAYDVAGLYQGLKASGALAGCDSVVWGGGEPTIAKEFKGLIQGVVADLHPRYNKIFSNSLKYIPVVSELLAAGQASLTTSIDAGAPETFLAIRGVKGFDKVLKNLRRYLDEGARDITVKYILCEENIDAANLDGFLAGVVRHQLTPASFQISANFKDEVLSETAALGALKLLTGLTGLGAAQVHMDDHLQPRIARFAHAHPGLLRQHFGDLLADPEALPRVAVWGAGQYAWRMIRESAFFRRAQVAYFVDMDTSKVGRSFMDHPVRAPEALLQDTLPIVLGASARRQAIQDKLAQLGAGPERLVQGLIV